MRLRLRAARDERVFDRTKATMLKLSCRETTKTGDFFVSPEGEVFIIFTQNHNNINILRDTRANGRERDWKGKKKRSLLMADHYGEAGLNKKAERMAECANVLSFKKIEDKLKLFQAYFCKVRLCPMCNWRRSLKIAFHNKRIVETVNERENVKWLFLTLTVRNVESNELKNTMGSMTKAWNRFVGYAKFKKSVKGYFRAMEVTKNRDKESEWYGTYHPHFHILLCVPSGYFQAKYYVKQADWVAMWRKAMKLDYDPIVYVQRVKPKKESPDFEEIEQGIKQAVKEQKAILEVSKYPVKDTDVIQGNEVTSDNVETVLALDNALAYKRLIAYGGLLKDLHKELNLDDAEDGDLIHVGGNNDEIANATVEIMAYWHIGLRNYVISGKNEV